MRGARCATRDRQFRDRPREKGPSNLRRGRPAAVARGRASRRVARDPDPGLAEPTAESSPSLVPSSLSAPTNRSGAPICRLKKKSVRGPSLADGKGLAGVVNTTPPFTGASAARRSSRVVVPSRPVSVLPRSTPRR